jgi:hypothetical protein
LPDAADTAALRLFWDTPAVWQQPPELSPRPWPTLAARIVTAVAGN